MYSRISDRPGLRNPDLVQRMQGKLKMVLSSILLPQHPDHASIFTELMTMIHDLRTLNTLHTEKFLQQCKINSTQLSTQQLPAALQQHLMYVAAASTASSPRTAGGFAAGGGAASGGNGNNNVDRESTGNASPQSSSDTSTEDHSSRRSPIGSVSSSESICASEVSKLTVQDLKVNGSVLMNALTASSCPMAVASSAATITTVSNRKTVMNEGAVAALLANSAVTKQKSSSGRKLDSPSDSGIDSPKNGSGSTASSSGAATSSANQQSSSTNTSVCSSPRSSSMDDDSRAKEPASGEVKSNSNKSPPIEESHPLLKRALQQPPQPYNLMSTFQDEVYKPHKKFRRNNLPVSDDSPTSSTAPERGSPPAAHHSSSSLLVSQLSSERPSSHSSLLASTLSKATPMATQEETKRNEILANLILNNPTSSTAYKPTPQSPSPSGLLMCANSPSPYSSSSAPSSSSTVTR